MAQVPGKEVDIGGTKYIFPPVNLAMRRKHEEFLARAVELFDGRTAPTNKDVLEMGKIVAGAFQRNYPDVDFAALEADISDDKLLECFLAVMAAGRAGPQLGEAKPGSP